MAVNLYVAANLAKIILEEAPDAVMPFILPMLAALVITTYFSSWPKFR
jgi:TRAP-type C4-dicarboxylate transport system permease large subunit